ncbi:hypothetical protein Poli38472_009039 [Pythium oligandrum]|uniref:Cysteine dioxygenase n=1 Tax=Pythium oligandrum TaxID=41045 RepID=A0A8K1CM57_PYTOL|nr:hypothetical protein Poli38472_009039 [Pythium oligandrum]|eukprot:TMW64872.1 hypothetical protein Poli38472_009039 [Pythium oligandrum]
MTTTKNAMTLANLVESIETLLLEEPEVPLKDKLKIQTLLEAYPVNMHELKPFAHFDPSRNYTRNLISTDHETYALMLICWNRGKYSPIHDHPSDGCWVKCIQGHVNEVRYERRGERLVETSNIVLTDGVTYMDDSLGFHKVGNPREDMDSITMHLYAPPYEKCRIWFDPENAEKSSVAVTTYFSEFGERIEL